MRVYSCDILKVAAAFVVVASTPFKQNVMSVLLAKYHFYLMRRGECNKLSNCFAHLLIYSNRVILHQEFVYDFALRRKRKLSLYFNGSLLKLQRPFWLGKMFKLLNSVYCIGTC